jgi:Putative transposase.
VTMVLHTWGQTLTHHPHLHCIVPGGGLLSGAARWVPCRPGYFLPERVLSRLFRRLFLTKLMVAHKSGKLRFSGDLSGLSDVNVVCQAARSSAPDRMGGIR